MLNKKYALDSKVCLITRVYGMQCLHTVYILLNAAVFIFYQLEGRRLFKGVIYYLGTEGSRLRLIRHMHFNWMHAYAY